MTQTLFYTTTLSNFFDGYNYKNNVFSKKYKDKQHNTVLKSHKFQLVKLDNLYKRLNKTQKLINQLKNKNEKIIVIETFINNLKLNYNFLKYSIYLVNYNEIPIKNIYVIDGMKMIPTTYEKLVLQHSSIK